MKPETKVGKGKATVIALSKHEQIVGEKNARISELERHMARHHGGEGIKPGSDYIGVDPAQRGGDSWVVAIQVPVPKFGFSDFLWMVNAVLLGVIISVVIATACLLIL